MAVFYWFRRVIKILHVIYIYVLLNFIFLSQSQTLSQSCPSSSLKTATGPFSSFISFLKTVTRPFSSFDSFIKKTTCPFSFPPPSPVTSSFLRMATCPFPSFISTSVILVEREKLKTP